jgi:hypothetical protein
MPLIQSRVILAAAVGTAILLGAVTLLLLSSQRPTDTALIRLFSKRSADFELLVRLARQHNIREYRAADELIRPSTVAPEVSAEIQKLSKDLGVVYLGADDGGVMLAIDKGGSAVSGWTKGFQKTVTPPSPILSVLDSHTPWPTGTRRAYRHIERDWYLFESR